MMNLERRWRTIGLPAALLVVILLAYGLRLHHIDAFSFWTDEGLTPLRSGYPLAEILSNRITIQEGVTRDTHPPLYYLVVHVTHQLFGETDFAYRYPSLLLGVLLVPLMFQFGRRLRGWGVGLLAAMLTAVNPLQIYYANEARMYTLFVLLAAAASYVLWRALQGANLRRSLVLYLLLAGLAFYTHYTAVFIIGVQAFFWMTLLWQKGYRRLLIGTAVLAVLLAIPVIPFTVPRLFTGAEANYFYVSPLVMLQDVVHFFGLGMTTDFKLWTTRLLDLLLLALLLLGVWAARPWRMRLFLLGYLLAVVFGLMAGSLLKPMYQGARHIMVGSPAFILLLALGADLLLHWPARVGRGARPLAWAVAAALALVPFVGAAVALNNFYNVPEYAKDDFRSMIAHVEAHAGPNDVLVYNNAILLPLHDHYRTRADLDVTALPIYPRSSEGVDAQLAELAQQYDRIWFVTDPPADKRDDAQRVRGWLDANLSVVDQQNFHARTTVVNTITYGTAPAVVAALPENGRSLDFTWPGLPVLRGIQPDFTQPASDGSLWFDLFWQGDAPPENALLRFRLLDPTGEMWQLHEQRLAGETAVWPADGLMRQSYSLPIPRGTPPGSYTLTAQPLDGGGMPLGDPQPLGNIQLSASDIPAAAPAVVFENGLALQQVELYDEDVRPGHTLPLNLYWQALPGADLGHDLRYRLDVLASDGSLLRTQEDPPGAPWLTDWPTGMPIREPTGLYFGPDTPPGRYQLRWTLENGGDTVGGRPYWRPWYSEQVLYGSIDVVPWSIVTELPADVTVVEAAFGPNIELYGYELGQLANGRLPLTLTWRATGQEPESYLVFIHLVNTADGSVPSQIDSFPLGGLRPTNGWRPDEVITDPYELALPADLPPGEYAINLGFYVPDAGTRLPVTLNGVAQPNDQLTLTTVTLP